MTFREGSRPRRPRPGGRADTGAPLLPVSPLRRDGRPSPLRGGGFLPEAAARRARSRRVERQVGLDLAALEDTIWAIARTTWALPAHLGAEPGRRPGRGLPGPLCLRDGFPALAEIRDLSAPSLPPSWPCAPAAEVERRVLVPFVSRREPWNWSLCGTTGAPSAVVRWAPRGCTPREEGSERDAILSRVLPTLERFLTAHRRRRLFGRARLLDLRVVFFTAFADLLLERTGAGSISWPRRNSAVSRPFPGRGHLNEKLAVSFADGTPMSGTGRGCRPTWRVASRRPPFRRPPWPLPSPTTGAAGGRFPIGTCSGRSRRRHRTPQHIATCCEARRRETPRRVPVCCRTG
jgi:hypothetical protein